jgi:hypothetical protein
MGIFATMISLGLHEKLGWSVNVSGSMSAAFILGIIFIVVGGIIIKFSIDYAFTKYQFSYYTNEFSYTTFTYGHLKEEKRCLFSQIEEFDIRESTERQRRNRYRDEIFVTTKYHAAKIKHIYRINSIQPGPHKSSYG